MQAHLLFYRVRPLLVAILITFLILPSLQSCYSIRIRYADAVAEQSDSTSNDFYSGKKVRVFKKNVKAIPAVFNDFEIIDTAQASTRGNGYYSVEYRVSLGMVLLNIITFGAVKKANIKVVSIKKERASN